MKLDLSKTIRIKDCIVRRLYIVRARNFRLGIYDGKSGFIGRRNKFGFWYLFTEFHYDIGPPFGTVIVIKDTGIDLPENIELNENNNKELEKFLEEHNYLVENK